MLKVEIKKPKQKTLLLLHLIHTENKQTNKQTHLLVTISDEKFTYVGCMSSNSNQ